ncbi:MAG: prolyl oligopeptidase family serine peptidase, partial [Melioribacteraceae bacterium]|nr:prolyl oligopeptidase family serine peptidase [Melioribacteraceae bacterium]
INCYKSGFFGKIGNNKIGLLGHSRGGGISILNANHDDVSCISVWASVATFERYGSKQIEDWEKKGFVEVINTRTSQVMRMNRTLLDDIRDNKENLDIIKSVKNLKKPLLIVHGKEDLAVPVKEANMLFEASNQSISELYIIESTGHTFNAVHPFNGSNPKLDKALIKTKEFFDINLN